MVSEVTKRRESISKCRHQSGNTNRLSLVPVQFSYTPVASPFNSEFTYVIRTG
jgi:hypothetical protein